MLKIRLLLVFPTPGNVDEPASKSLLVDRVGAVLEACEERLHALALNPLAYSTYAGAK
jgi:hypothetical protein